MTCISPVEYQSYHWYQWTGGIPPYSCLIHCENILSPLNEMHFINGIPIDCLVSALVPIVPLVPMDDRNPPVILPDSLRKHSKSPYGEMNFTNGIPIDCQVRPLVPFAPLVPMDERNPPVFLPDSLRKHSNSY